MPTLAEFVGEVPALVGLALLVGGLVWLIAELQRLRELIEPIASSPVLRAVSGVR